jgi:hypothetical protein
MNRTVINVASWTLGVACVGGLIARLIPSHTAFDGVLVDTALVSLGAVAGLASGLFFAHRSK